MKADFHNILLLIYISLLFSLISGADKYYNHTSLDKNLYFVFSTFRHGAREPFVNPDYFGNPIKSLGSLTNYGGIQHFEIGKKYRQRYSNFLNMNFDPKQMYIRSSNVERTIISTLKELEGLFGKAIDRKYLKIVGDGLNFWNLYQLNDTEKQELYKYFDFCKNKKRRLPNIGEIFPILKECYNVTAAPDANVFCDSVYTAYFKYIYENDINNKIGKCGREKADKMHQFCVNLFDTYKGWDEKAAYMFYILYQNIFKFMFNAIEEKSDLKMVMIGGHDITVDKFMDFLNGLKIIPRTHYPHYACNIVIELRKYNDEFYLEFYYNDILKYNETFQTFMDTLDNSKYSNLYNYCGFPPWIQEIKTTETIQETTIEAIEEKITTQKIEKNSIKELIPSTQILEETIKKIETPQTQKVEIEDSNKKEEIHETKTEVKGPIIDIAKITQTQKIEIETTKKVEEFPQTQKTEVQESTKKIIIVPTQKIEETFKNEVIPIPQTKNVKTEKVDIVDTFSTKNEEETYENEETEKNIVQLNNLTNITQTQELIQQNSTFAKVKMKLKKFFKQESDVNLYIILVSIISTIILIIFFAVLIKYLVKKKRKFMKLSEEPSKEKNVNDKNNSLSVT